MSYVHMCVHVCVCVRMRVTHTHTFKYMYNLYVCSHLLMCYSRELRMTSEAEQLLNDMCSLYCPERWTMFSANAVSLLAECQKSLHLDSKYPTCLLPAWSYTSGHSHTHTYK